MIYELKEPIKFHDQVIKSFKLEEKVKAKHLKGIPLDTKDHDDFMKLIARISGNDISVVEELAFEDYTNLLLKVQDIMGKEESH